MDGRSIEGEQALNGIDLVIEKPAQATGWRPFAMGKVVHCWATESDAAEGRLAVQKFSDRLIAIVDDPGFLALLGAEHHAAQIVVLILRYGRGTGAGLGSHRDELISMVVAEGADLSGRGVCLGRYVAFRIVSKGEVVNREEAIVCTDGGRGRIACTVVRIRLVRESAVGGSGDLVETINAAI